MTPPETEFITTTLLLDRLRVSHDEEAWRLFDLRFRGVLIATGRSFGLNASDAEEAAQDTVLQAVRDLRDGRYDRSRGRLSSWIVSIARHRIIDTIRKRRPAAEADADAERETMPAAEQVEQAFDASLERQIFSEAWESVCNESGASPATLLAFELTAMRGVPAAEAARQCGISIDQVYVARNRVARRLKDTADRIGLAVRSGL